MDTLDTDSESEEQRIPLVNGIFYKHNEVVPLAQVLWGIAWLWDPFGLLYLTIAVWCYVLLYIMRLNYVCCRYEPATGARCAAAAIPHSHTADRLTAVMLLLSVAVHPFRVLAFIAFIESFLDKYWSIKGVKFFFNRL